MTLILIGLISIGVFLWIFIMSKSQWSAKYKMLTVGLLFLGLWLANHAAAKWALHLIWAGLGTIFHWLSTWILGVHV